MRTAQARIRQTAEKSPYELAEIAARREGLDLDEWLERVVADEAAQRGLSPEELEPDERLDAIARRLLDGDSAPAPAPALPPKEPDARIAERFETAIEKLEARTQTSEARTAQAFESLTQWLQRSDAERQAERESLRTLNERLARMDAPPQAAPAPAARPEASSEEALARDGAHRRGASLDASDAVGRIARRQAELDALRTAAEVEQRRKSLAQRPERARLVADRDVASRSPDGALAGRARADETREPAAPQDDVAALGARLERMRAKQGRRRPSSVDTQELRAGLAAMSRSVADLAPRNGALALQGAVGELGERLSRARGAGADGRIVAPVEAMLRQVLDTLKSHDPRPVVEALERDLRAIGAKVEKLAETTVTPDLLDAIRRQSQEVSRMLAAAASNAMPAARLESQIKELSERVDQLAHDPAPHAEVAEVMQMLGETQAEIAQSTPTSALRAIERRVEELAARIDEAVRRPPAALDVKPIEELSRRIDGVRASIDRQASIGLQAAAAPSVPAQPGLEATLRDINAKLDRVAGGEVSAAAMIASLQDMTNRLEDAFRRPQPAALDPGPAQELAQRIEGVRGAIERQAAVEPRVARLEAAIGDLAKKLDRPQTQPDARPVQELASRIDGVRATVERQGEIAPRVARIEAAIGGLSEKLERPAAATLDTRPLDDLARRIEGLRSSVERQGQAAPRIARIEATLDQIAGKLERPGAATEPTGLNAALRELTERIEEAFRRPPAAALDPRPIEELAERIEGVRATVERQANVAPQVARLEATLGSIAERLERPAPRIDAAALNAAIEELPARIEEAMRRRPPSVAIDPAPIHDLSRRIEAMRALVERQTSWGPQIARLEEALADLAGKIERASPGFDGAALVAPLEQLAGQIEEAFRRQPAGGFDPAPLEDLARRVDAVRASVERQTNWAPQFARLEGALSDLTTKLERAAPGLEGSALIAPLEQLAAQIDEAFRRQPAGGIGPAALEDLARRVESVRATVERGTNWGPQFARLESSLGDLAEKFERASTGLDASALVAPLEQLAAQVEEAFRRPAAGSIDPAPIEDLARRVERVRASVENQTDWAPQFARLEAALADLARRSERTAPGLDASALVEPLAELAGQVDEALRRPAIASIDSAPLEDLARRIENVRSSVERQANWGPQFARLESALAALSGRIEKTAPGLDAAALSARLDRLGAQIEEALRRPPAPAGGAAFDELARRIDGVRATVERQAGTRFDMSGIEAALREVGGKLERPSFTTDDLGALIGAIEDLSARVDQGAARLDAATLERMLNELGDRIVARAPPAAADLGPIERRLDQLAQKIGAGASPSADIMQLELAIRELGDRFDQAPGADMRGVEAALRALRERLDERDDPQIDLSLVERAVDLIAKRLEQKVGTIDAETLVGQISEIHGRLDALGSLKSSSADLDRTLAEMTDELEAMREQFDKASAGRGAAGLQAEQANFDRRMEARFAGVQATLEGLGERLRRIEGELTSAPAGRAPPLEAPAIAAPAAFASAGPRMRDIPDRGPAASPRGPAAPNPREPMAEPAASAPPKHAAINAHIAAARRAANAALEDSARREEAAAGRPREARSAGSSLLQSAQNVVAHYRRPLLLGGAGLLAAATTLAVVSEFHGAKRPPLQKSEITAPNETPVAELPPPAPQDAAAAALDPTPTGSIATGPKVIEAPIPALASPGPARAPAAEPAPADLIAELPSGIPQGLRDGAAKGDVGSEVEIALRYIEGRTVPRDMKLAARWLERAADAGSPFAQYRLGALYEKGVGVTRDAGIARGWYSKAANAGNARAMHNLAVLDAQDGGAGKPDYAEAANWFRRAAALGIRDSQFNLGVLYGRGLGVPLDLPQSWMWFSLAAQQGDGDAAHKRDEVANRLDGKGLAAANKALAEFKAQKPTPEANDAPPAAGAVDAKTPAPPAGAKS